MPSELITLESLYTLVGMVTAITLVVSFFKLLLKVSDNKAKWLAWITGVLVVGVVYANQGFFAVSGLTAITTVGLMWILNSMLVTLVAMKAYEGAIKPAKAFYYRTPEPAQPDIDQPHLLSHRHQDR